MQEKILSIITDFHPMRVSRENIYDSLIERYGRAIKITTFITEFYNLVKSGNISGKDQNGRYGLGVIRTKRLDDWLPVTHEQLEKDKILGENNGED